MIFRSVAPIESSHSPSEGPTEEITVSKSEVASEKSHSPSQSPPPSIISSETSLPSMAYSQSPSASSLHSSVPTQGPSNTQSNHPSSLPSLVPSAGPSKLKSASPSATQSNEPTTMASLLSSNLPSTTHSISPSYSPAPSTSPTAYNDTLTKVYFTISFHARNTMNATETKTFRSIVSEVLSEDTVLDVYSVTVILQKLNGKRKRQMLSSELRALGTDNGDELHISGLILGEAVPFTSTDFGKDLFIIRVNRILNSRNLSEKLLKSIPILAKEVKATQDGELDAKVDGVKSKVGPSNTNAKEDTKTGMLLAQIGAGIGFAGFIVIAALLARKKPNSNRRTDESEFSDRCVEPDNDGIIIVEADTEIGTGSAKSGSRYVTPRDPFENNDRFSTLSYSDTDDSEYVHERDFQYSLTSSSLASNTLSTIGEQKDNHTLHLTTRHNLPATNLPIQQLVRPDPALTSTLSNHQRFPNRPHTTSTSFQDDGSMNEYVRSGTLHSNKSSISRMFSCGGLAQSLSGLVSDGTPRVSNLHNDRMDPEPKSSTISVVSSLSGKSSCSSGSVSLSGEPYEVLVPASKPLGLVVKTSKLGPQVLRVKPISPLYRIVKEGDYVLSADGVDARFMSARELSLWLHRNDGRKKERTLFLMSRTLNGEDDDSDVFSDVV